MARITGVPKTYVHPSWNCEKRLRRWPGLAWCGGSFIINPRLLDVERIEVVKGPHAALYGRSAFAGAVNYITKKPGDKFEANVQVDAGTYGKYEGRGSIALPVSDKLSIGMNAEGWNFDGFYKSTVSGAKVGGGKGLRRRADAARRFPALRSG